MCMHKSQLESASFICTIYIAGHEPNSTICNGKRYQQFPYYMPAMTIANFAGEMNIPVLFDNVQPLSIMPEMY